MVCIAAFIILALVGLFVAILSIFKREIGRAYWKVFKKAWGCVWKKVRLQKCETNFKDDVKNSILKKVVLKKPSLVKPLSIVIEVVSVIIVAVVVWAIIISIKSLLALWALGTCNVSHPASCALGSESCSIDEEDLNWFSEWGEIFAAIPDRFKSWQAEDYLVEPVLKLNEFKNGNPSALDVMDPGCSACLQSYKNQLASDFSETHNIYIMVYPIELDDGTYKFNNSGIIARYIHASNLKSTDYGLKILNRIFTEKNEEGIIYQNIFNNVLENEEAEELLKSWLKEFGATDEETEELSKLANSDGVTEIMQKVKEVVNEKIRAKGIPTLIYNERKHLGLFKI